MKKNIDQVTASATLPGTSQRMTGGLAPWGLASLLTVLTFASPSLASPAFPNAVREAANMSCTPSCTLCHETDPGVSGSAGKPFATAMLAAGLEIGNPDSVAPAYASLPAALDMASDDDSFTDQQELEVQDNLPSDPNNAESTPGNGPSICAGEVLYGCGAQIAPSNEPQPWTAWFLLLAVGGGISWRLLRRNDVAQANGRN